MANQGVDLDVLKANAASGNQVALANLDASLRAQGMDDARIANYMQTELGVSGQRQQGEQFQQSLGVQKADLAQRQAQFMEQLKFQTDQARLARKDAAENRWWQLGGALLGGASAVGAAYAGKK
jgi:hypothetical protein